jgi:hypothetical protein
LGINLRGSPIESVEIKGFGAILSKGLSRNDFAFFQKVLSIELKFMLIIL